jgi:hypothetical protein
MGARMMSTMRRAALVLAGAAAVGAATPAHAFFFDYAAPQPPVGGDCTAIAAEIGPEATWYGEFAGNRYDDFTDQRYPYSTRGCFVSQYDCRVWQNGGISYLGRGGIVYMRCTKGLRGKY